MTRRGRVESAGTFVQTRGYHTNRPTEGPAMQIVLDVADEFKSLVDELTLLLRVVTAKVEEIRSAPTTDYAAVERELAARTAAIEAQSHGLLLRAADLDTPRIRVGGKLHRRVGRYLATYFTSAGPVVVERSIFVPTAGETETEPRAVDPVSLRLGVVGRGWLPHTARAMAFLLQQGTAREAPTTASELGRSPDSAASFDHVAHAVGALFQEHSATIEQALIEAYEIPASVTGVSVSLDRVCMPVEEPRPRPVGRPRKRAPKKPVQRVFRQAYCATVTLHDAIRESVALVRDEQLSPEASPFLTVWSLQKWAELVGHSHWPEWVEELGLGEGVDGTPPTEDDGVAWSFALAWQLHKMPEDTLAGLVRWHQASFNRAMTTHCPETLRPLIKKVFTPAPFKPEDVERAVMTLIESDSPVTYLAVAEAIGVSPSRIGSNSIMREIVDRAEPVMRQKWCDAMGEKLRTSQKRLKAAGRRVSRLNLAKDAKVSLEAIARHEKETGETFAISPSSQYAAEVKRAIRSLRERGVRITTTAVARELKRDRNLIEKDPDLKAIVKAAQEGKITEVDVRGACRALRERELPITIVAVAEFLDQGRHVIERSEEFRAVVEEERRIVAGELKREIEDAVWRLAKPGGPPSDPAISKAIGRERSFLSKHENLQALVREFYWTKLKFPDR